MPTTAVASRKVGRPRGSLGERIWRDAINVAVKEWRDETTKEGKVKKVRALRLLARKLVDRGLEGDVSALREIGDRLDGKAMQGVDLKTHVTISGIERRIIDVTPGIVGIAHLEGEAVEVIEAKPGEVEPIVTNLLSKDVDPEPNAD